MSDDQTQASPHAETEARIAALQAQGSEDQASQQEKQQSTQAPPEVGTSATAQDDTSTFEAPFNLNDITDDDVRGHVERYHRQLQGAFTQKTQELAEQRKQTESVTAALTDLRSDDPEVRQGALEWLSESKLLDEEMVAGAYGWELEQAPAVDELEPDDPIAQMRNEITELQARLQQRDSVDEAKQQEEFNDAIRSHIDSEIETIETADLGGRKLTDEARGLIEARALLAAFQGELTDTGMPNVRKAYDEYAADRTADQKGWAQTKITAQPTLPGGQTATEAPDLDNERERQDYIAGELSKLAADVNQ